MDFDPVLLARLQFAFTIAFHIIFPSFTIGLSAYIATLHVTAWLTGRDRFLRIARFWTKIFAVSFGMGVVSGVVLSYQLGTNWSRFSRVAGNIVGPLAGYEVLSAFFLEASFLAILLFGGKRVPRWLHVLSAVIVAIGTATSAFWILSANSWMHTPAGHEMRDGIAFPVDWWAIVFNPSFPYRLAHMLNASYLTAGFVVLAVGAAICSRATTSRRRAPCCAWRSACSWCWRRCKSSSATSTASTRSSISRPRSPRWRRIGTASSPATSTSSPGRTPRPRRTISRFRSRTARR